MSCSDQKKKIEIKRENNWKNDKFKSAEFRFPEKYF